MVGGSFFRFYFRKKTACSVDFKLNDVIDYKKKGLKNSTDAISAPVNVDISATEVSGMLPLKVEVVDWLLNFRSSNKE